MRWYFMSSLYLEDLNLHFYGYIYIFNSTTRLCTFESDNVDVGSIPDKRLALILKILSIFKSRKFFHTCQK